VASVVGGGIGTILVVIAVALLWPQLRRIGPLHTITPQDDPDEQPATEARHAV
jgi:hypothetical protein